MTYADPINDFKGRVRKFVLVTGLPIAPPEDTYQGVVNEVSCETFRETFVLGIEYCSDAVA